jgi:hypothetical protein
MQAGYVKREEFERLEMSLREMQAQVVWRSPQWSGGSPLSARQTTSVLRNV